MKNILTLLTLNCLLLPHAVQPQTNVSGNVSDTWTKAESPYRITGELLVPEGDSLIIEPGVEVQFAGKFQLKVEGLLQAIGTENDSIVFNADHPDSVWSGIFFDYGDRGCELRYARIEQGSADAGSGGGIQVSNTDLLIRNCLIRNNFARFNGGGIYVRGRFNFTTTVIILDSKILDNTAKDLGSAVYSESHNLVLSGNLITQNKGRADLYIFRSNFSFANNVVFDNTFEFSESHPPSYLSISTGTIINSIFWEWGGFGSLDPDNVTVNYCAIEGGVSGEGNTDGDPLFVDPDNGDFSLQVGSPASDAGHPSAFFNDRDGSRNDMGIFGGSGLLPDPIEIDFGPAGRGQTKTEPFYVHNFRDTPFNISSVTLSDQDNYSTDFTSPMQILPGSIDTITVFFHPVVAAPLSEKLTIVSPDLFGSDTASVDLSGDAGIFSGAVSGFWDVENSPYVLDGRVTVAEDQALRIEPGAEVRFRKNARLEVFDGETLIAEGKSDSIIVFTSDEGTPMPGDWGGIYLSGTENAVVLRHCQVQYATNGITVRAWASGCRDRDNYSVIEHCKIRFNSDNGIYCVGSGSSISGCIPIARTGASSPKIRFNWIYENAGNGVEIFANDGYFSNGYVGAEIYRNLIFNNGGSGIECLGDDPAEPKITNNTVYKNSVDGIRFKSNFSEQDFIITNNLIGGSTMGLNSTEAAVPSAYFNDVWGNGTDYAGISASASDISLDPLFVDVASNDYQLQANSPAIDAGDPASPPDADHTRADMGALPFLQAPTAPVLSSPPDSARQVGTYPTLIWHRDGRADSYQVQVANGNSFSMPVIDKSDVTDTTIAIVDTLELNTTYFWRVNGSNVAGASDWSPIFSFDTGDIPSAIASDGPAIPTTFAVQQNYPNPFNPETTIQYQLPEKSTVKLVIYNLIGQRIVTLVDKDQVAGYHSTTWQGRDQAGRPVASGVYLYRFEAEDYVETRKLTLLR